MISIPISGQASSLYLEAATKSTQKQFSLGIIICLHPSLIPRPSSLVGKNKGEELRPGKTYDVTDVTDCGDRGQFQERGRTPTHSEHANTGLPKSVHLHYTQGG